MQLSKSEYMMFLKHPTWLWLKKHDKSKLPLPDANLQAIFDEGILFEKYAEKRFHGGIRLGFDSYKDYLLLPARTRQALRDENNKIIFQGRFETSNITCICDVVERVEKNTFDLYEIKSSTKVKPEHYLDLAFQTVVLESAGLKVRNIAVVTVNNKYIRNGEVDPIELSKTTDVTNEVRDKIEETKEKIRAAMAIIEMATLPDPSPRHVNLGALKDWMDIYRGLGNVVPPYSIYDLITPGTNRLGALEDLGVILIKDIPNDFKLTPKQERQVVATSTNTRYIEKDSIKIFLGDLKYPLYFLDYETFSGVIPPFDGIKPYQQTPFQYSLHILDGPLGEIEHKEYLHTENTHPGEQLLKRLQEDIGPAGSVIVWYEAFEKGRNSEMAEMFPAYENFLSNLNDRVVDLMIPFSNGWFVDKDFFGSSSLKKILPVIVSDLSYKELDIQEGNVASRKWMETVLDGKYSDQKEKIMSDLIKYCRLDTLAMVEIFKYLKNI